MSSHALALTHEAARLGTYTLETFWLSLAGSNAVETDFRLLEHQIRLRCQNTGYIHALHAHRLPQNPPAASLSRSGEDIRWVL